MTPPTQEVTLTSPFAQHPAFGQQGTGVSFENLGTEIIWTPDMDDMLRTGVRRNSFNFEAAAQHVRTYIMRLRTGGGILHDDVVEVNYTVQACRERWAHLDFVACRAFRQLASGEVPEQVPAGPLASAAQQRRHGAAAADDDEVIDDDGSDNDDDDDDYGIVNLDALRAQRLGGLFGAAPSHKAARPAAGSGGGGGGQRSSAAQPRPAARPQPSEPPAPQRQLAPPAVGSEAADFGLFAGRSQQLAELESLAAQLSSPTSAGVRSNGAAGGAAGDGAAGDGGGATEQHRAAAAALHEPLGELKRRMEGLEAMLADEATDMAAKLGEVAQVHREMAELQSLAQQCHSSGVASSAPPPQPQLDMTASALASAMAETGGGGGDRQPLRFNPATRGGVNLEAALDGLDIDGLLERLEAEQAQNGHGNGHA